LAHIFACGWYFIGQVEYNNNTNNESWIQFYEIDKS